MKSHPIFGKKPMFYVELLLQTKKNECILYPVFCWFFFYFFVVLCSLCIAHCHFGIRMYRSRDRFLQPKKKFNQCRIPDMVNERTNQRKNEPTNKIKSKPNRNQTKSTPNQIEMTHTTTVMYAQVIDHTDRQNFMNTKYNRTQKKTTTTTIKYEANWNIWCGRKTEDKQSNDDDIRNEQF